MAFGDVGVSPKRDNHVSVVVPTVKTAAADVQNIDSLDAAYQLDFTQRLAIEFAIVDGCYKMEWDSNRWGQTHAHGGRGWSFRLGEKRERERGVTYNLSLRGHLSVP